ncbi:Integrin alpha-E [Merluccius polli]|uniref:Integrin alpha-E n=1 Tax=Merluccius polli TaxID=89951 RepID=A0AA47NSD5_MERPO|nr:Integrin alpha-E [Merluccius polli]
MFLLQRISPASIGMTLRHFGQSVSAFSNQLDKKRQLHISVGSEGNVTIFETLPVIVLKPTMELNPGSIPIQWQERVVNQDITLKICFTAERGHITNTGEELQVFYNIYLDQDEKRLTFAYNTEKGVLKLTSTVSCLNTLRLNFNGCYDCFTPIVVRLNFTLNTSANHKPIRVLDIWTPNKVTKEVEFDNDCGGPCVPNISLSDSKLNHDEVVIGLSKNNSISFNLTNSGKEAYMTMLVLTYPHVLHYSHITVNMLDFKLEEISCEQTEETRLKCSFLHPLFRKGAQANFVIHWQIVDEKAARRGAKIYANLTCANQENKVLDTKIYTLGIKNALTDLNLAGTAIPTLIKFVDKTEKVDITFTFKLFGENKYNATLNVTIELKVPAHGTQMIVTTMEPRVVHVLNFSEWDDQGTSSNITASANVDVNEHFHLMGKVSSKVHVTILKQKVIKSELAIIVGSVGCLLFLVLFVVLLCKVQKYIHVFII